VNIFNLNNQLKPGKSLVAELSLMVALKQVEALGDLGAKQIMGFRSK